MEEQSSQHLCATLSCNKPFRVIPQEKKFYLQKNLPLPEHCPTCRHRTRMALRGERQLYSRQCGSCKKNILSTFPKDAPYTVYCQECFWKNIG